MTSTLEAVAASGLLIGLSTYVTLTLFFVYGWLRRISGRAALAASVLTASWFAVLLALGPSPLSDLVEVSAYAAWLVLIGRILGVEFTQLRDPLYRGPALVALVAALTYAATLVGLGLHEWIDATMLSLLAKLVFCLCGIILLEQVARNTRRDHEWNLKYLVIGLGIVFAYGFVLYADALLFNATNFALFAPQGWIYSVATPFICIASLRNRSHRMSVNLSRRFVFRTGTLLLAGTYLLIMGTAGYYVRYFGGEWGQVFEVFLISAALIALAVVSVSGRARALIRETIARNLYDLKYDYRDEWLRVTRELTQANPDEGLGRRAIRALADLLHANAGAYWRLSSEGLLLPMAQTNAHWNQPLSPRGTRSLLTFFAQFDWIIDLDEYRRSPAVYEALDLHADAELLRPARFVVPLTIDERLFGIIAIGHPTTNTELIWEDYDILKIIARQTAAFLALQHADSVLSASKQLRAMDQMSAFVVHDLKTVTAQLTLLLRNAERHRTNPAFIDDMLKTVEHAVARTSKLVDQLRSTEQPHVSVPLNLIEVVRLAANERASQIPAPIFETIDDHIIVRADRERLVAVIGHVIQNAQDATAPDGIVRVRVEATAVWAIVAITDNGSGMSPEFIDRDLFAPFATTKGVAGIGIGAYQCREYIRDLGGDVAVRSQLGVGTEFTLRIPLAVATTTERVA